MLAKHRNYLLQDAKPLHAHVEVIPTGLIAVEILEKHQNHQSEFDQLHFDRSGNTTKLVGKEVYRGRPVEWQLPLAEQDANELEHLIEEASEELEILMRDL
ncbi:hypothetical protein [Vibrio sp.]|uniref:hypothetical protein n=1 Tax=Vibrio sp. TaxID=678 RepID=UPI003D0C2F3E